MIALAILGGTIVVVTIVARLFQYRKRLRATSYGWILFNISVLLAVAIVGLVEGIADAELANPDALIGFVVMACAIVGAVGFAVHGLRKEW